MKGSLVAAVIVAASASPAFSAQVWQGDLFLTGVAAACKDSGFAENDFMRAVFKPAGIEDNGTDSRLLLVGTRNAVRIAVTNGSFAGSGSYTGAAFSSQASQLSWTGTFAGVKIKPAPSVNVASLSFQMKVTSFFDIKGCTVTLKGSLGVRPGL
jgi:hypothetical protein